MGSVAVGVECAGVVRHETLAVHETRRRLVPVGVEVIPWAHAAVNDSDAEASSIPSGGMGKIPIHSGNYVVERALYLPVRRDIDDVPLRSQRGEVSAGRGYQLGVNQRQLGLGRRAQGGHIRTGRGLAVLDDHVHRSLGINSLKVGGHLGRDYNLLLRTA